MHSVQGRFLGLAFGTLICAALFGCTTATEKGGSGTNPGGSGKPPVVNPPTPPPPPAQDSIVAVCSNMQVSNAPLHDPETRVLRRPRLTACVNNVLLNIAPAVDACLSSGYGPRGSNNKMHRGLDYNRRPAGEVIAAARGKVVYRGSRPQDFGNVVYVDHGEGVYTGYAHLADIASAVVIGSDVEAGERLGTMGTTGAASRAIHLHFEARTGTFRSAAPSSWFQMTATDLFTREMRCE